VHADGKPFDCALLKHPTHQKQIGLHNGDDGRQSFCPISAGGGPCHVPMLCALSMSENGRIFAISVKHSRFFMTAFPFNSDRKCVLAANF
jgi:hypothetical protein